MVRSTGIGMAVEHASLRAAMSLPGPLARRVAGSPIEVDGCTLDLRTQLLLRIAAVAGGPSRNEVSVAEARKLTRRQAGSVAGRPIEMARVVETDIRGAESLLPARIYVPDPFHDPVRGALLIYFHGGGHVVGDLDTHDRVCRFLAHHSGVPALAVDYRLAPEHPFPAAAEDAIAVLESVVQSSGRLGELTASLGFGPVDRDRVAVAGDSAGGNLAAVAALAGARGEVPPAAFQLLLYPICDYAVKHPSYRLFHEDFLLTEAEMDWYRDNYLLGSADGDAGHGGGAGSSSAAGAASDDDDTRDVRRRLAASEWRCSPLVAESHAGLPPAYVATAGFDPLRDEGEAYAEAMRRAGVEVRQIRHAGLVHSFANQFAIVPEAREAMLAAAAAVREALGGGSASAD